MTYEIPTIPLNDAAAYEAVKILKKILNESAFDEIIKDISYPQYKALRDATKALATILVTKERADKKYLLK